MLIPICFRTILLIAGATLLMIFSGASARGQGFSPDEAVKRMTTLEGLKATLYASEPNVRQPILTKVDDRGRLWTIQYLQYPNPAGLKRVSVDRWSRAAYDRVPKPPPHGPRGADRITILADTDGDGRADTFRDFVDGLNLATGLAFGHGGVYVLQVPYLLFYPDRNRDDVPDSDPQVLLTGFGMEDAQSLANHLTWGPDGWLYGVNGSTTTCKIRGIEFQQGAWRYHPLLDEFELFCEGGGNTFGLTFDERGNLFYSTNGGPFVHALQGAYYRKSFGKHGPLHNLHAYGHFEVVERDKIPGGPPTGGTIYQGTTFPSKLRGTFISGNFLGHTSSWWDLEPRGSTFVATYGGVLLDSHDTWFGPTDMCAGPDGAMYVSDFHDQRTGHPQPDATWDLSNGRIYRIAGNRGGGGASIDIATLSSNQLVDLLTHPNGWYADRARVHLAARRDSSVVPRLKEMAAQSGNEIRALRGLWALHVSGGFDEATALQLLDHPSEYARMWTVRLLGDKKRVPLQVAQKLRDLASKEASPVVRCQLAATARRLSSTDAVSICEALLDALPRDDDDRTPWMIWWAIESHAIAALDKLVECFSNETSYTRPSRRSQVERLLRRWAAEGTERTDEAAWRLLTSAPSVAEDAALAALAQGIAERSSQLGGIGQGGLFDEFAQVRTETVRNVSTSRPVAQKLSQSVADLWRDAPHNPVRLRAALACKVNEASSQLLSNVAQKCREGHCEPEYLELVLEFGSESTAQSVLPALTSAHDEDVLRLVIQILGRFGGHQVTRSLLKAYPDLSPALRSQVVDVLLSRPMSARSLISEVGNGGIDKVDITIAQLRNVAAHQDDALNAQVRGIWGRITPGTTEEKLATMRRFRADLKIDEADLATGKLLFVKHCATCHTLFGEGNKVGPDLTTANRNDIEALLANLVDPSAVVRREYMNYTFQTTDGRVLTGLLAEQDAVSVTVLDAKNQRTRLRRDEIAEMHESDVSLMPERILEPLTAKQRCDLIAYLMKK